MKRYLNVGVLLKLLVVIGIGGVFGKLLLNGNWATYMHPRMVPYIAIALMLLSGMTFFEIPQVWKPSHHLKMMPALLLLVILMVLVVGEKVIGKDKAIETMSQQSKEQRKAETFSQTDRIEIADEDFGKWYIKIYEEAKLYEGKKIRLKGQVLHDPELGSDEFVPSRRVITCCAADAGSYGFVCRSPQASSLKEDEWVWVTGTLYWQEILGEEIPVIEAIAIEKAEPPIEEYATFE
ncbi:TIGR03943 family protein [Sporanaerobium hydrogeniformans]|uniref:TIGR03943 family protein n=1 Tax=Sporanaerobium hydrogeniformans TaxID=3072179 RepID=A0AC61DG84_9FIRM|nr:TIGR03943 family protein [Sporanaerobium hydrogeniformans]PHV71982.1 TIGR03943 family protein [Sporanaerobium hydrogeniformans]